MSYKYINIKRGGYAQTRDLYSATDGVSAAQFTFGQPATTPITQVTAPVQAGAQLSPVPDNPVQQASVVFSPPPPIVNTTIAQNPATNGSVTTIPAAPSPTNVTVINPIQTPKMSQMKDDQSAGGGASESKELFTPCVKCFIIGVVVGAALVLIFKKKKQ